MMRVSSEGIRVELFPDLTPLDLHFPSKQRINDARWHHVAFVWDGKDGMYSIILDAVRIFADTGYATGQTIEIE